MLINLEKSKYANKAKALFMEGYNCSQSVFLAFEDLYDMDRATAAALSSSFGGGLGRMREICGCVLGMSLVAGILKGYSSPKAKEEKAEHYKLIQELAGEYKNINGSYICRELLAGINTDTNPIPDARTDEYYKKRPCPQLCAIAAAILEEKLEL